MKHASLMYTCMGLMAAAAVVGFIDHSIATKNGTLKNLYKEEVVAVDLLNGKIEIDDYSRGPIEYDKNENYLSAAGDTSVKPPKVIRKVERKTKSKRIAPPPPPKIKKGDVPPPPPPKKEVAGISTETIQAVPAIDVKEVKELTIEPAPVTMVKEISAFERFSRAPLPKVRKSSKTKN